MISIWKVSSDHLIGYYVAIDGTNHKEDCFVVTKQAILNAIEKELIEETSAGFAAFGEITHSFKTTEGEVSLSAEDSQNDFTVISDSTHLMERFIHETKKSPSFVWKNS